VIATVYTSLSFWFYPVVTVQTKSFLPFFLSAHLVDLLFCFSSSSIASSRFEATFGFQPHLEHFE
jgi:hypothetical protein